jgi:hypothetical protein
LGSLRRTGERLEMTDHVIAEVHCTHIRNRPAFKVAECRIKSGMTTRKRISVRRRAEPPLYFFVAPAAIPVPPAGFEYMRAVDQKLDDCGCDRSAGAYGDRDACGCAQWY